MIILLILQILAWIVLYLILFRNDESERQTPKRY